MLIFVQRDTLQHNPSSAGQEIISNPLVVSTLCAAFRQSLPLACVTVHHWISHSIIMFSPVTSSMYPRPSRYSECIQLISESGHPHLSVSSVCSPHYKEPFFFTNPCWTSHLQECDLYDLFRPSSGDVFLWNSAKVPALQGLVNSVDKGVNHLSHVTGEWIKRGLLGP